MLQQAVLDLAGADAVAAGSDDVVVASEEVKIALVVQAALVAGHQPVAAELGGGSLGIAPVLEEHHRVGTAHRDGAGRASRALVAVVVDEGDSVGRQRPAPGASRTRGV